MLGIAQLLTYNSCPEVPRRSPLYYRNFGTVGQRSLVFQVGTLSVQSLNLSQSYF